MKETFFSSSSWYLVLHSRCCFIADGLGLESRSRDMPHRFQSHLVLKIVSAINLLTSFSFTDVPPVLRHPLSPWALNGTPQEGRGLRGSSSFREPERQSRLSNSCLHLRPPALNTATLRPMIYHHMLPLSLAAWLLVCPQLAGAATNYNPLNMLSTELSKAGSMAVTAAGGIVTAPASKATAASRCVSHTPLFPSPRVTRLVPRFPTTDFD